MLVAGLVIVAVGLILSGWVIGHFSGSRKGRSAQ
jgi:hypothetical protein